MKPVQGSVLQNIMNFASKNGPLDGPMLLRKFNLLGDVTTGAGLLQRVPAWTWGREGSGKNSRHRRFRIRSSRPGKARLDYEGSGDCRERCASRETRRCELGARANWRRSLPSSSRRPE